jgi:hypothetical protein
MYRHSFVITAATLALAGLTTLARADTPVNAPEPRVAEPAPATGQPAPAADQPAPATAAEPARPRPAAQYLPVSRFRRGKGWFLGGSMGIGSVAYSGPGNLDSKTATFFDARLGGMLTERLALSAEFWSDGHRKELEFEGTVAATQNCLGLGATYWATPHLWVKAALGTARLTVYSNGAEQAAREGLAYTASTGYEIVSRRSLSVDLSLRLLMSSFDTSVEENVTRSALSLHAGANWY